mmetsp:Transcript_10622/g.20887  ORF Transcript_10622/g.20887 Transcript_10622/m.20887 type:complete len:154 (+) Transcript_10622:800-1261(+)|eukprot:CAMPEP_0171496424 /NCGR_PEP_ID=MMETSP0958-20121227/6697_1 /TAXON_ID=87120 /ORGANISM="Aurantiochytrium limacinum, Strain ATCCMYA-1381" /LENGTH=153 /DNA_ID=CAMNT_0012030531 /DNA_START=253 /DNA_END=714 /DNA_ORIENTATION=-
MSAPIEKPQASHEVNNQPNENNTATFIQDFAIACAEKNTAGVAERLANITPEEADDLVQVLDKLYRKDDVMTYDNFFHETISNTSPLNARSTARLVFAAIRQNMDELADALVKNRKVDQKTFEEEIKNLNGKFHVPEDKLQSFVKNHEMAASA